MLLKLSLCNPDNPRLFFNRMIMIQIGDVVVSFDVLREKFLCDLGACQGICCIEGDAGAPVELDEVEKLEEVLPLIWDELSPEARTVIDGARCGLYRL